MQLFKLTIPLLAIAAFSAACSGMGTTMTKMGRMGQNKGYEIAAQLPAVQQASQDLLKARGYEVSIMPDRENGAGGAGLIVIGQRIDKYKVAGGSSAAGIAGADQRDIRELINIYLSKKWQMSSNEPAPNITLVEVAGGSYRRAETGGPEVETPVTDEFKALVRNEIERRVADGAGVKAPLK